MAKGNKKGVEIVCPSCLKKNFKKMLDESDKALGRYTKKLKKEKVMSNLYWCNKNKVVWEKTFETRKLIIYKKNKYGKLVLDGKGNFKVELDENDKPKHKIYDKVIHIYKGFPSYGLERRNIPSNDNDEYFIDSSVT